MKKLIESFRLLKKNESGAVAIIVAVGMVMFLGFTALVIDGGRLYIEKSRLQKAADAGALAGAQEIPVDEPEAETVADTVAKSNNTEVEAVEVDVDASFIEVTTKKNVEFTFAKAIGFNSLDVQATAKVELNPMTSGKGVIPIGMDKNFYEKWKSTCSSITLKISNPSNKAEEEESCIAADLGSGNTGALTITSPGGNTYRENLKYGSETVVEVNMLLETETGSMVGPTIDGIKYRTESCSYTTYDPTNPPPSDCKRVVTIPVYEILEKDESKNQIKKVKIIGFAVFFIENVIETSPGNGGEVTGKFIDWAVSGDSSPSQTSYGAYGYKLVN